MPGLRDGKPARGQDAHDSRQTLVRRGFCAITRVQERIARRCMLRRNIRVIGRP
jgi:hypothetical protein